MSAARMLRAMRRAAAVGAMLCAAAACAPKAPPAPPSGYVTQSVSQTHTVRFAPGQTTLAPSESSQLQAFLRQQGPAQAGSARITSSGPLAAARLATLAAALNRSGVARAALAAGDVPSDQAVVTVTRSRWLPAACLSDDPWPTPELPPPGCANALNLLHSVADTADLTRGRTMGLPSAGAVARAAERYLLFGGRATSEPVSSFEDFAASATTIEVPVAIEPAPKSPSPATAEPSESDGSEMLVIPEDSGF